MNYDLLESSPDLYLIGKENKHFNLYIFWRWYLYAVTCGLIIYWNNTNVLSFLIKDSKSEMLDLWSLGSSMYTCIVFVVNLKLMLATNTHNLFSVFLLTFCTSSYLVTLWVSSKIPSTQVTGEWDNFMYNLTYISALVHIITSCVLCEYAWRSLHYIIEEYIIKRNKVTPFKRRAESDVHKYVEDSVMLEKGFSVKINQNSINNTNKSKDFEEPTSNHPSSDKDDEKSIAESEISNKSDDLRKRFMTQVNKVKESDQTIVVNKHRRCNEYY
jgi:hypothetical protein